MPKRVRVLSNIEIDEISFVDRPANQHAKVAIAKRATEEVTVPEIYDEQGEAVEFDSLEPGQVVFDEDGQAYVYTLDAEDEVEDERELATVGKSASFADQVKEELSKAITDVERDSVISKAMQAVELADQRALKAEEIAKAERDLRLVREYTEVAKSYNVPVDGAELGPVLMRMAETMSYDDCAVIHKALSAAGEAIYEEIGFIGGGDNVDVLTQVDAYLDESIAKSAESVSKAKAMEDFFATNPAAYDEYIASRRGF